MLAHIQTKLDAAKLVRDREQALCDAADQSVRDYNDAMESKQDAIDILEDNIDDLDDDCVNSIFKSERTETYRAIQASLTAEKARWEDSQQTATKIDDIVHTWDMKADTQAT